MCISKEMLNLLKFSKSRINIRLQVYKKLQGRKIQIRKYYCASENEAAAWS